MKLAEKVFRRTGWYVTSPFGPRTNPVTKKSERHNGTDYGTNREKWPQYALEDGIVTVAGADPFGAIYCWVHYPRIGLEVQHFHLDKMFVKKGQKVTEDTVIGNTGTTGKSTGIHLHLALRKFGSTERLDPHKYDYVPPSGKKPDPGEIKIGDRVRIKQHGVPYYPGEVKIPDEAWLRSKILTVNGLAVKGGVPCARLKEITTWCAVENLERV